MRPASSFWPQLALLGVLHAAACAPAGSFQEGAVSDRGGFPDPEQRLADSHESDYCAAEILRFRYHEAAETLHIADARLLLGCCGQRAISVARVDSMIELTERDDPDPTAGRCDPSCAFDFAVSIPAVPSDHVVIRLLRDISDSQGGPSLIWQGQLDLSQPVAPVVLDDTPASPACHHAGP
jgi:hypothetical protein